jgi:hypothetical protein
MSEQPVVLRFPVAQEGAFVNACLVETAAGVVAVDSLPTVSESRAMRQALARLGKPLQAVLLTHSGVTFDCVRFTVIDLGPSESPHDSPDPRSREHRPDDPLQPEQARGAVIARMKDYEPADELHILMELSIDPVAQQLGLLSADATLSN